MKKDSYPLFISRSLPQEANARNDLIERLSAYGKAINKYSKGKCRGLRVLTSTLTTSQQKSKKNTEFIKFITAPPHLIRYMLFLKHYININKKNISVLVSSDPWADLAIIKIVNLSSNVKVQVSIHGEPYLRMNYLSNYRNLIKHLWLKFVLNKVDSIRVVSQHQISEISKTYSVDPSKIFVAPIPVTIPNKFKSKNPMKTIVFLGRMHPERGIKMWIEMVLKLYEIRQDFDLLIIGDGIGRDFFQKSLANSGANIKYEFVGWVEQKFIAKYLKKTKVLLNTAQTESFGLAMREAQINGIPIVSLRTTGAIANFELFGNGIFIFDELESGLRYLSDCLDNSTSSIDINKARKAQELQNCESLMAIANSWIKQFHFEELPENKSNHIVHFHQTFSNKHIALIERFRNLTNKSDSSDVVDLIIENLKEPKVSVGITPLLKSGHEVIDQLAWEKINASEVISGEIAGKPRVKEVDWKRLISLGRS